MVFPPVVLPLKRGQRDQRLSLFELINFIVVFLPGFLVSVPIAIVYHHILRRFDSAIVNVVGRPWRADLVVRISRFLLARATPAQARILFNRTAAYKSVYGRPEFKRFQDWLSYVEVDGTAGRWIAPPEMNRAEDDVVIYFIHGGGFLFDSGSNSHIWLMKVLKELNLKRGVKTSVFALDYRLAPEYQYPSQLIEVLAGYHYLVNKLGVSPASICIAGDSAGGNLVAAFMLHLARPNPSISVPRSLGSTPSKPAAALLISPFVNLASTKPSRESNRDFDYIESHAAYQAALDYIGVLRPKPVPSFNPLYLLTSPYSAPPLGITKKAKEFAPADEAQMTGLELLSSPYVDAGICEDKEWWKEALPGEGKTMIAWGAKEILSDDIEDFVGVLRAAGVNPKEICKSLGAHDWLMTDSGVPGVYKTKSTGVESSPTYGVDVTIDFLLALVKGGDDD